MLLASLPYVRLLLSPQIDCKLLEDYVALFPVPPSQTSSAFIPVSTEGVFVELISINSVFN